MDIVEHIKSLYDIKTCSNNTSYSHLDYPESYFLSLTDSGILIKINADENFNKEFMSERFILPLQLSIFPVLADKTYIILIRNIFHISWFEYIMKRIKKYVLLGKCRNYEIYMREQKIIEFALNVIIKSPVHKYMEFKESCILFNQDDVNDLIYKIKKGTKNRTLYKSIIKQF